MSLQRLAERGAAVAVAQVAAHRRRHALQALGDLAELLADLLAGELARLGGLGQADAGADEQRLDARDRRLHRLGDLVVGERVDLAQQQRGALGLGQVLDVRHQLAELLALVDLVGGRRGRARRRGGRTSRRAIALLRRRWFSERLRAIR